MSSHFLVRNEILSGMAFGRFQPLPEESNKPGLVVGTTPSASNEAQLSQSSLLYNCIGNTPRSRPRARARNAHEQEITVAPTQAPHASSWGLRGPHEHNDLNAPRAEPWIWTKIGHASIARRYGARRATSGPPRLQVSVFCCVVYALPLCC